MAEHYHRFRCRGQRSQGGALRRARRERAVAAVGMPPVHAAPGCLERDPEAMWTAVCNVTRKVLSASGVEPSSIAAVGLTGYGNGLFLVDRHGRPVRNAILSPDQIARKQSWPNGAPRAPRPAPSHSPTIRSSPASRFRLLRGSRRTSRRRSSGLIGRFSARITSAFA